MTRTDYAYSGSEGGVTERCLAKGYFQGWTRVVEIDLRGRPKIAVTRVIPQRVTLGTGRRDEASARTQVYLSKTKLRLQVGI